MRPDDGLPNVAADVFPLTWPGHDAWQDPGFGWTPPLTLPPLAGATAPPGTVGDGQPVPERLAQRRTEREQHAVAGASGAPGGAARGGATAYSGLPPWPNWQRQAT